MLTVRQLIDELKKYPEGMEVLRYGGASGDELMESGKGWVYVENVILDGAEADRRTFYYRVVHDDSGIDKLVIG